MLYSPSAEQRESSLGLLRPLTGHALVQHTRASMDGCLRRFFAKRGVPSHDVPDLIQEIYLRLARRPDAAEVREVRSFVFTTAANLLRDKFRRQASRGVHISWDVGAVTLEAESDDPERSAVCSQEIDAAIVAMQSLKPVTQRVFIAHRMLGWSYAELAAQLNVSVSMIEKHMTCAIAALAIVDR